MKKHSKDKDKARSTGKKPPEAWVNPTGYQKAIDHLRACSGAEGFWASTIDRANYRRVWSRDGVIIGLAALLTGDSALIDTFRRTLHTLSAGQGPHGEIPSNVDTVTGRISFGGAAGRVDGDLWFVIGCGEYWRVTKDRRSLKDFLPRIQRTMKLLGAWEFNDRGLLYVPQTGDWADEYLHSGYVLYDQLLYLQAQASALALERELTGRIPRGARDKLRKLWRMIRVNYWFADGDENPEDMYHKILYSKGKKAAPRAERHWMPFFLPSGYGYRFDAFANVLVSLLGVADDSQRRVVDDYIQEIVPEELPLLPAFHPVIKPVNKDWNRLHMTFSYTFRNQPHEFQNGGLWTMITGFYVADLAARGKMRAARRYLKAIHEANAMRIKDIKPSFPEYIHGRKLKAEGTPLMGWSAAASIIGEHAVRGEPVIRVSIPSAKAH